MYTSSHVPEAVGVPRRCGPGCSTHHCVFSGPRLFSLTDVITDVTDVVAALPCSSSRRVGRPVLSASAASLRTQVCDRCGPGPLERAPFQCVRDEVEGDRFRCARWWFEEKPLCDC